MARELAGAAEPLASTLQIRDDQAGIVRRIIQTRYTDEELRGDLLNMLGLETP